MGKGRLEAFSDGVLAIILTIMVLELRVPHGAVLWANLHLLFWLSLFPFATGWMGENNFAPLTMATFGLVTLMAGFAHHVLQRKIIKQQGAHSVLALALGRDWKGKALPLAYLAALPLAFVRQWIAGALYVAVALIWLVPVRRIARVLDDRGEGG